MRWKQTTFMSVDPSVSIHASASNAAAANAVTAANAVNAPVSAFSVSSHALDSPHDVTIPMEDATSIGASPARIKTQHPLARAHARMQASFKAVDYLDLYRHVPYYIMLMMCTYIILFFLDTDYNYDFTPLYLNSDRPKELWRTYTYSLVHANTAHLTNNCIMFLSLGCILNVAHGSFRIALLNSLGCIGGAIAVGFEWRYRLHHASSDGIYHYLVVGASGGIYSLMGAHAGNLSINWSEMPFRYLHLMMLFVMVLTDVLLYVYEYNDFISYSAHSGGFLTGALLGPLLLINVKKRNWEKYLQYTCGALTIGYAIAGLVNFLVL